MEERDVPYGWGVDQSGHITTNPDNILNKGGLTPLGGSEETAGYKGYGLAMGVDILCGVLAGSNFGTQVPPWRKGKRIKAANLGQCFVALDPNCFAEGFQDRLSSFIHQLHSVPPVDKGNPVLVAGDPERATKLRYKRDGISIHPNLVKSLKEISQSLKVPFFPLLQ